MTRACLTRRLSGRSPIGREAGLLKVSVVKPVIATVAKDLVVRNLGRLSEKDRHGLEEVLRSILGE